MKSGPPSIETILELPERPLDYEYDIVGTLDGVRGTWHRLWAAICVQKSNVFGGSLEEQEEAAQMVKAIREEFESKFGRALSSEEYDRLELFSEEHSANLNIPK